VSYVLLHRQQPQTSVLSFDLLRGRGFASVRRTSDAVADARDFVDLALDVFAGAVAVKKGVSQRVKREEVNAAFKAALFAESHPLINWNKRIVVTLSHQTLQCRLASIVHAAHTQRLHKTVNAVGQDVLRHRLIWVQNRVRNGYQRIACGRSG